MSKFANTSAIPRILSQVPMSGEESLDNPSDSHSLGWEGQWDCGSLGGIGLEK